MSELFIPIGVITLLILLNGLFVAAEFAIVGAPHIRIAQRAVGGSITAQQVLKILRDPNRQNQYLATAQVGITIASLGLGMYGEHTVAEWLAKPLKELVESRILAEATSHTIAAVLAVGLLTYLHVVLGEMIPKTMALQSAESTVLRLQRPMNLMGWIFWPIVTVLNGIGNSLVRLVGIPPASERARLMSPEELEIIVGESFAKGLLEADEQLFIENIFDLSDRTVGQVMTPRTRITGIPVTADEQTALRRACQARFTRLPVYEIGLDQIVGILHIKDLARHYIHSSEPFDLHKFARPAVFVPESLSLEHMLIRFRKEGIQMAIVIDEFGGTAGLVTIEDLVEEVVGEILDEFDQEIAPMQPLNSKKLRVRGDLLLDELNQHYDLNLEHPEADTVGGLIMALLGRVLKPGDKSELQGVRFEVESVKGLAVQTVLVYLPHKEELHPDSGESSESVEKIENTGGSPLSTTQ